MSFARRTVSGNPIFFTLIVGLGGFFASITAPIAEDPTSYKIFFLLIFFAVASPVFLWLGAIYRLGAIVRRVPPSWAPVFVLAPACMALVGTLVGYKATVGEPVLASLWRSGTGILVLASVWKSAEAMETALDGAGAPIGKIARTAGHLFFCIVGIWALRDRLLTLCELAEPQIAASSEAS
jgi:hypothetical protein